MVSKPYGSCRTHLSHDGTKLLMGVHNSKDPGKKLILVIIIVLPAIVPWQACECSTAVRLDGSPAEPPPVLIRT